MPLKLDQDRLFKIIWKYRYYYILSVIICSVSGYILTKLAEKKYQVQATVLVRTSQQYDRSLAPVEIQQGFSSSRTAEGFRNEILYLTSYKNIEAVLKRLDINVSYFVRQGFFKRKQEVWSGYPFKVQLNRSHVQGVEMEFEIEREEDGRLRLKANGEEVSLFNTLTWQKIGELPKYEYDEYVTLNDTITTACFSFVLEDNMEVEFHPNYSYSFKINNFYKQVDHYRNTIRVNILGTQVTAAEVNLLTTIPKRGELFMTYLLDEYLSEDLEKKNQLAQATINYIDYQIAMVEDSLSSAESLLKTYKSSQNLTDISAQNQQRLQLIAELQREKAELDFSYQYYKVLNDQLIENDFQNFVLPSQGSVEDMVLSQLVTGLLELFAQRRGVANNGDNSKNIFVEELDSRINAEMDNIQNHLKSKLSRLELGRKDLNARINELANEARRAPDKEIRLAKFERRFNLEDELYSFLLRKRAEAEMSKESNLPNKEIVNPARLVSDDPVLPRKKVNYFISVFLGVFIPSLFVLRTFLYNKKIFTLEEIEDGFKLPVIGRIKHLDNSKKASIKNTPFEESLRYMNYYIDVYSKNKATKVLGMTSSMSSEGKSFISFNLAQVLADSKQHVICINMDYRKSKALKEKSGRGIYDVLGGKAELKDVIKVDQPYHYIEPGRGFSLSILGEDGQKRISHILEQLKTAYDYIILDFPPVGIVSDYLHVIDNLDIIAFVVRLGVSDIVQIEQSLKNLEAHVPRQNVNLIINDIKVNSGYYGKYYK
ncbi:GumC family protein [Carboxylicivirga taeanensis]|uniref:GumC family protein n=1 Tax=Carboxylicivirga taeanensis TaxID=1416875 RepID=UPI003F6DB638